jgi:hypothetical protein
MLHGTSAGKRAQSLSRVASTESKGDRRALKMGKKGGSSSNDEPICLTDYPANAVAAAISFELASLWDSVTFDCTPVGVADTYARYFLPDASVTIQGKDIGLNSIEEIQKAFVGDETTEGSIVYACSSGQVFSWYMVGVEVLDCTHVVAKANEMISAGSSPLFDADGDALPGGREYTYEFDQDNRFLNVLRANIVCPFEDGVNACAPA